jgi:hypothetical protein
MKNFEVGYCNQRWSHFVGQVSGKVKLQLVV